MNCSNHNTESINSRSKTPLTHTLGVAVPLLVALILGLSGCATPEAKRFKPVTEVPSGTAVVHIYRNSSMLGAADVWDVFANKQPVTVLRSGTFHTYTVAPGRIVYSLRVHPIFLLLNLPPSDVLTLHVEAGQTYFVRYPAGSGKLVLVDSKRGEQQIRKCELTDKVPAMPPQRTEKEAQEEQVQREKENQEQLRGVN
jgi:hypothetical protein